MEQANQQIWSGQTFTNINIYRVLTCLLAKLSERVYAPCRSPPSQRTSATVTLDTFGSDGTFLQNASVPYISLSYCTATSLPKLTPLQLSVPITRHLRHHLTHLNWGTKNPKISERILSVCFQYMKAETQFPASLDAKTREMHGNQAVWKNEANHGDPLCCRCAKNYLKGHQRLYCVLIRGAKDITACMFPQPFQEGRQKQGQGSES